MKEDAGFIASLQDQVSSFQTTSTVQSVRIAKLEAELQEYRDYYQSQGGDDVYTIEPYLDEENGTIQEIPEYPSGVEPYTAEEAAEAILLNSSMVYKEPADNHNEATASDVHILRCEAGRWDTSEQRVRKSLNLFLARVRQPLPLTRISIPK
mgnify:CR=1 FL=1